MKNNKLITLLLTFSKNDLLQFKKYLLSPFFNENEKIIQLFDLIQHKFLKDTKKQPSKQEIWLTLFGKKTYRDVQLRRLFSDLNQLANGFLAYQKYKNNPVT